MKRGMWALTFLALVMPGAAAAQVELVGEGHVSTPGHETFPAQDPLTGDLWFSTYDRSFDGQTIYVMRRQGDGWAPREVAAFSGNWGDRAPRFGPDGSALYFTSNRPRSGSGDTGDMNTWRVERTADGWGEPELLGEPFNTEAREIHAVATSHALWFASTREGSRGLARGSPKGTGRVGAN